MAAASPNTASLLTFKTLAGASKPSPLTNAGGTIADVFNAKDRGLAMAIFAAAPFRVLVAAYCKWSSRRVGWI
jgi:hypothetical protein